MYGRTAYLASYQSSSLSYFKLTCFQATLLAEIHIVDDFGNSRKPYKRTFRIRVASQYKLKFRTVSDIIHHLCLPITAKQLTPDPNRKTANAPTTTTLTLLFPTYPQRFKSKF
jgi:hypothetical protein